MDSVSEIRDAANQKIKEKFEHLETLIKAMKGENDKIEKRLETSIKKVDEQERKLEKLTTETQYWRTSGKGMEAYHLTAD